MALIPLIWLAWLEWGEKRHLDTAWWWLAAAFLVSWMADSAADLLPMSQRWVPSMTYPVAQTAIMGAVLLQRTEAIALLGLIVPISVTSTMLGGAEGPEIVLRTFAWLSIVLVAWFRNDLPHRLRLCLIVYFGLGYATWLVHTEWLIVATWYSYHAVRLAGLLLFCWAANENSPHLRLVR